MLGRVLLSILVMLLVGFVAVAVVVVCGSGASNFWAYSSSTPESKTCCNILKRHFILTLHWQIWGRRDVPPPAKFSSFSCSFQDKLVNNMLPSLSLGNAGSAIALSKPHYRSLHSIPLRGFIFSLLKVFMNRWFY